MTIVGTDQNDVNERNDYNNVDCPALIGNFLLGCSWLSPQLKQLRTAEF